MSDYIKREDAIKAMARGLGIPYTDFIDVAERCMDDIQNADAVEVVRCKDCKYAEVADKDDSQDGYTCQFHRGSIWFSGDFCSWGERAEE